MYFLFYFVNAFEVLTWDATLSVIFQIDATNYGKFDAGFLNICMAMGMAIGSVSHLTINWKEEGNCSSVSLK